MVNPKISKINAKIINKYKKKWHETDFLESNFFFFDLKNSEC